MARQVEQFEPLAITNPNTAWVVREFDKLLAEWMSWNEVAQSLADSQDYDPRTCTEAIKDGWDNLRQHDILREKTLVFLRNHFTGTAFLFENWPPHPHEDNTSRLKHRVPYWIHRLQILKASVEYARVPEGFWREKGKELVTAITKKPPEKAAEIAASYLKNPLGD